MNGHATLSVSSASVIPRRAKHGFLGKALSASACSNNMESTHSSPEYESRVPLEHATNGIDQ